MKTSTETDKILPLLLKVKSRLKAVSKGTENTYFKSKYATLNDHLNEVEPLLSDTGLILLQPMDVLETGKAVVESRIVHVESGQWVSSQMPLVTVKDDMQQLGAAATYARRFTISALLSMQAEDLDGEDAVGRGKSTQSSSSSSNGSGGFKKPVSKSTKTNPVTEDSWT